MNNNVNAQSVGNYSVTRTTGITYSSISATGSSFAAWRGGTNDDDNRSQATSIGFDFWYNGTRYTTFSVSTNGYIDFSSSTANGGGTSSYGYQNTQFSAVGGTLLSLAPIYDDLDAKGTGQTALDNSIKYLLSGTAPNRVLTVEWIDMAWYNNGTPSLNFQVKVYENTGVIDFIHGTMTAGTATYTYTCGINASTMAAPPTTAQLLTQQTANTETFSNTVKNDLSTIPASNTMLTFTPPTPANPSGSLSFTDVTSSSMRLNWTEWATNEVGYVIYRSTDDVNYSFVSQTAANATFSDQSGLLPSTTYYWRVYAVTEGRLSSALAGSQNTLETPPPGVKTWVGAGAGGSGTIFNDGTNWSPAGTPTSGDSCVMTLTAGAIITLSADITIGALRCAVSGVNNVFRLDVTNKTLMVVNTLYGEATSGDASTQMQFSVGTAIGSTGAIVVNGNVFLGTGGAQATFLRGIIGSNSRFEFKGNVTFGAKGFTSGVNFPGKYVFSGTNQTLTANTGSSAGFSNVEIGDGTNPTTVTLAGTSNAFLTSNTNPGANLTIKSNSTLDFTTRTLNRTASGGSFTMEAGSTMKLAASTGGQTGSNFPLNYSTITLNATSIVDYNAAGETNQTIFATPTYGFLKLTNGSGSGSTTKTAGAALTVTNDITIASGAALNANNLNISVAGNWSNSGAFTAGTGTVTLNGSATQTIGGSSTTTFNNLTTSSTGMKIAAQNIAVGGNFTNGPGITTSMVTYTLTISGTKTNGGTIQFAGSNNGVVFADGIVEYNGTVAQTVTAGTYYHLVFTNSGLKTVSTATTAEGNVTINAGASLTVNSAITLQVNGDIENAGAVTNNGIINLGI